MAIPAKTREVLQALQALASPKVRDEMASRYGIYTDKAHGVRMADMQKLAKGLGRDHKLAAALWDTGWYEARTVAALIDDPAAVTRTQMDRWCRDFDNWAICDTVCFKLFDKTPHAWGKVAPWAAKRSEFERRAGFALLASLALHDKTADNAAFIAALPLIEAANDDRNFVKKAASWAMRAIAGRNPELRKRVASLAKRMAASGDAGTRWVGKDTLRRLIS
jgi:3-methyladenine DNA glycosylase AlkD